MLLYIIHSGIRYYLYVVSHTCRNSKIYFELESLPVTLKRAVIKAVSTQNPLTGQFLTLSQGLHQKRTDGDTQLLETVILAFCHSDHFVGLKVH